MIGLTYFFGMTVSRLLCRSIPRRRKERRTQSHWSANVPDHFLQFARRTFSQIRLIFWYDFENVEAYSFPSFIDF
jgi:hypothetical protein